MAGACTGLESTETTLTNPGPCASGGIYGDTEDAGGQVRLNEGLCEESVGPLSEIIVGHIRAAQTRKGTPEEVHGSVLPGTVDLVKGDNLNLICKDKGH